MEEGGEEKEGREALRLGAAMCSGNMKVLITVMKLLCWTTILGLAMEDEPKKVHFTIDGATKDSYAEFMEFLVWGHLIDFKIQVFHCPLFLEMTLRSKGRSLSFQGSFHQKRHRKKDDESSFEPSGSTSSVADGKREIATPAFFLM